MNDLVLNASPVGSSAIVQGFSSPGTLINYSGMNSTWIKTNILTNLIQDGGFESPFLSSGTWEYVSGSGQDYLTGCPWNFHGGGGITTNGTPLTLYNSPVAPEGNQAAYRYPGNSISYDFSVSGPGYYFLSFYGAQSQYRYGSFPDSTVYVYSPFSSTFTLGGQNFYQQFNSSSVYLTPGNQYSVFINFQSQGDIYMAFLDDIQIFQVWR